MSGKRKEILATNENYHVFNKSVGHEEMFSGNRELKRMMELIEYYQFNPGMSFSKHKLLPLEERKNFLLKIKSLPKIVEIFAFALMPNHFHFLLKQLKEGGIRNFLSNIQNGYAKYFNIKNERSGTLFQKSFKAKRVANDEIFLHLSRYIHLNPITSYLIESKELSSYPWTSYIYYLGQNTRNLVNTKFLLKLLGSKEKFVNFVENQTDYQRKLRKIKKYILE